MNSMMRQVPKPFEKEPTFEETLMRDILRFGLEEVAKQRTLNKNSLKYYLKKQGVHFL